MRFRKRGRIGSKAPGLGPTAIEAEVVNLTHSVTSLTRSEMQEVLGPSLKRSSIQVGVLGGLLTEESVQRFKGASRLAET